MARNIQARRKLSELYRQGVEVRFGPGGAKVGRLAETGQPPFDEPLTDDEVALWVCPPSPLQRDQALRDAQAAKARALIKAKRDKDSEEHLTAMAFIAEMSDETLADYLLEAGRDDREREAVRDVLGDEEWKDMSELQDALRQFEESDTPEDDPEYAAVLERDVEYGRQVDARMTELREADRDAMKLMSREVLERRALNKRSELTGVQRFMQEFELQMTYYSVRDVKDRQVLFFESPRDFAEQAEVVQVGIKEALSLFINDVTEAKNSFGVAAGSEPSVQPSEQATSEPSTPEAVSA